MRILRCPVCGFSVTVAVDEPLPEEGPSCAMGHPETAMQVALAARGEG